jgi:PAS domain S-box-containing protein
MTVALLRRLGGLLILTAFSGDLSAASLGLVGPQMAIIERQDVLSVILPALLIAGSLGALATAWISRRYRRRAAASAVSAERLRFIFDRSPVMVLVKDCSHQRSWLAERRAEGITDMRAFLAANPQVVRTQFLGIRIVAANATILKRLHQPDLASLQTNLALFYTPDLVAAFTEVLLALWEGRHEFSQEIGIDLPAGERVQSILNWSVPMDAGRPDYTRVMSVFSDVTEQRSAEARLRSSEDRWQLAVQGINAGLWEIDYAANRFFVSERSREMLGYFTGELDDTQAAWESLIHPDDRAVARRTMELHLRRETTHYRVEHRLRCKDGHYRWVLARGLAQFDEVSRPVRFVGTHSDIHARKVAEEELAGERERLRVTLRAMVEAVFTTDQHGRVNYLNEAAEQLTGWAEGAAIGRPIAEIASLRHERSMEALPAPHRRALTEAVIVELPPATVVLHRQGAPRLVEGRCAPIRDVASQPAGSVLVLRDVTERARLEAEMSKATRLESVGVLAGGIAHDFNNLLTVIMGNVTLAALDSSAQGPMARWLGEAEKGLLRARDLTQQLLTFAKGGDPVRSVVQLAEIVRETAEFSSHGASAKCLYDIEQGLWAADVDKGQIGQVVQNLVINAVQAMPQGGAIRLSLHNELQPPVRTGLACPAVRITITDTGTGISPENLARIFDPYFTTKATGNGLGLATVYAIVKKHGGHIEVLSALSEGTTFRLWLPATKGSVVIPSRQAPAVETGMNGRVLLMDDEEGVRLMASQLLERLGFEVTATSDGQSAVDAYQRTLNGQEQRYDLVIMDLTVPGAMGGLDCMKTLQKLDPQVRAIVSSGYSSDPVMANFRGYGFAAAIPKPYRITDFAKSIRQVLEGVS